MVPRLLASSSMITQVHVYISFKITQKLIILSFELVLTLIGIEWNLQWHFDGYLGTFVFLSGTNRRSPHRCLTVKFTMVDPFPLITILMPSDCFWGDFFFAKPSPADAVIFTMYTNSLLRPSILFSGKLFSSLFLSPCSWYFLQKADYIDGICNGIILNYHLWRWNIQNVPWSQRPKASERGSCSNSISQKDQKLFFDQITADESGKTCWGILYFAWWKCNLDSNEYKWLRVGL